MAGADLSTNKFMNRSGRRRKEREAAEPQKAPAAGKAEGGGAFGGRPVSGAPLSGGEEKVPSGTEGVKVKKDPRARRESEEKGRGERPSSGDLLDGLLGGEARETKRRRLQMLVKQSDYDRWRAYADDHGVSLTVLVETCMNRCIPQEG